MPSPSKRIFFLSPAQCGGKRAQLLFRDAARFELALKLRTPDGAPLGDVFSFLSGLYFRAKLAYAAHFATSPEGVPGVSVITSNRGLLPPDTRVTLADLQDFGCVDIDAQDLRYRDRLPRAARAIAAPAAAPCERVLLGSAAAVGARGVPSRRDCGRCLPLVPAGVAGRGAMSRGGLMLRCLREGRELDYVPVIGSTRHGKRPPRLAPSEP